MLLNKDSLFIFFFSLLISKSFYLNRVSWIGLIKLKLIKELVI